MVPSWKWFIGLHVCFLLNSIFANAQTTSSPTAMTATTTNSPEMTTLTTTFVPTLTPFFTTEGTTLATADSAVPTTAVTTEEPSAEATTEGQASNEALRTSDLGRGYGFESTRNRPSANQEAEPETETEAATTTLKPDEKKIAWKFGRAGNNQAPWSSRPSPNSGFPVWKKEVPASNTGQDAQSTQSINNKPNDQAYIVWNVGQGNQQNGWALGGNVNSWAPAGGIPASAGWDANAENSPDGAGWNDGSWAEQQQSPDNGDTQGGWATDDASPDDGAAAGWDNNQGASWNPQNQNDAGWVNVPVEQPSPDAQSDNAWQSQGNDDGGAGGNQWIVEPQQNNNGGAAGWVTAQQSGAWAPPTQAGGVQGNPTSAWNNNNGGWNGPPTSAPGNTWQNGAPGVSNNGGWSNGQQSGGAWNNGAVGPSGWQDENLSWKVYNEDTKTMESLDDNSGWKVIGDGGPDGWKLVDENGNVEWKIENINGEWKVTSADEFSRANETTPITTDSVNATADATNDTSVEESTTTQSPSGGWDDDKQGRYIIWKFSEDGKGEARVYGGPGTEPEVWTVGDNNQWWKETMGVKDADTVVQGYNGGNSKWQGNVKWQNTAPQTGNAWQSGGNNVPVQNGGWRSDGGTQNAGASWQQNSPAGNRGAAWQNKVPQPQNGGNSWQSGNRQRGRNRWRNRGPPNQQKWNNGVSAQQPGNRWQNQNQATQPTAWKTANSVPQTTNGWQNPNSQGVTRQNGGRRQNGSPQKPGSWTNGGQNVGGRPNGRWQSNGNRTPNGWGPNNVSSARKNGVPKGRSWNSGNGWQTAPSVQTKVNGRWNKNSSPTNGAPAVVANPNGRSLQNSANAAPQRGTWTSTGSGVQTVPYIIVIKSPDANTPVTTSNSWQSRASVPEKAESNNVDNTKPQSNRRSNGWRMNRAGSSGWQWNPQGGSEGWQWRDGWMGSGGGFGGWVSDKGTMYSNWRPTKINDTQRRRSSIQRTSNDKGNKKSGSKMVFVFGKKRDSGNTIDETANKAKKAKKVIILDYSAGNKKSPNGDEGMKKDIESVIEALKTAKPTSRRRSANRQKSG